MDDKKFHEMTMLILSKKNLDGMTTADVVALYHKIYREVQASWYSSAR